ncbi:MAG TPA: DUF3943 domain-containing protein [Nitrospirales bacterium]|jgi:hypothetical protein
MTGARDAGGFRWTLVTGILILTCLIPAAGFAQEPAARPDSGSRTSQSPTKTAPEPPLPEVPKTVLSWETGAGRSYIIPALEIIAYEFALNWYDRNYLADKQLYRTDGNTFWKHLTDSKWVIDDDQFKVNQFLHPYGGTVYYGLARSAGLNFWESFLYTAVGSFLWEIGGETTTPSINDQISTTLGGSFLGEPLFRMANLLLERGGGTPGFWRELGAAIISPPTGFNRLVFGNRFDAIFPSHDPAIYTRLQLGGTITTSSHNVSDTVRPHGSTADFSLAYGLPGKPGYTYTRPFDYFDFHVTAVSANTIESIDTRGLLKGTTYSPSESSRGIWGLYGSYDYISPQVFRVSTAALSLGTTWQWWYSRDVALQGTFLGGTGYGAAGSIRHSGERDYHYGVSPQALLNLRLIFGDRAMADMTGREYYITGLLSPEPNGYESILRGDASFTLRVFGRHGLAVRYVLSHRDARYPNVAYRDQTVGSLYLVYVFLGHAGFGGVEWRNVDAN